MLYILAGCVYSNFVTLHCITVSAFFFYFVFLSFSDYYCVTLQLCDGRPALMSVCSSGSPPLAFIWFSLHVIHLANKSSSSSSSQMNDRLGHTTDCRPAWNKCVKPLYLWSVGYKFVSLNIHLQTIV